MSLGQVALGLASIALGLRQLKQGADRIRTVAPRRTDPNRSLSDVTIKTPQGPVRMRTYAIRNLDERIEHLRRLVEQGKRDPVVYQFARKAVNGKCGSGWCVPEKNNLAEAQALFKAVRSSVRYTSDIAGIDSYQKPAHTLKLRTGDCLPEGTKLLRSDGTLIGIEDIQVGDVVFDGVGWTKVTKWWDKGMQPVRQLQLNNGSTLRCTDGHKLFRVPRKDQKAGSFSDAEEVLAQDIQLGDELLQPRELAFSDVQNLSDEEAFLLGAFLAEGSRRRCRVDGSLASVSIAGVPEGKGIRERAIEAATKLGFSVKALEREVYLSDGEAGRGSIAALFDGCGTSASNKKLPHVRWSANTAARIVEGLNADGGTATNGTNFVFSTTSPTLAVQYRLLQRILGRSCSIHYVEDHGGLGTHPIYRVTVREGNQRRPWARVRGISEGTEVAVYDIETESHRFYVPEQDIIVHNCDDYSILTCAAAATLGLPCRFKVIRTKGSPDWNHIYAQIGFPRRSPKKWVAFDASVNMPFGWEAPAHMVEASRVFPV